MDHQWDLLQDYNHMVKCEMGMIYQWLILLVVIILVVEMWIINSDYINSSIGLYSDPMVRMVIERLRLGNGDITIKLVNTFALQWDMFWIRLFFLRCL